MDPQWNSAESCNELRQGLAFLAVMFLLRILWQVGGLALFELPGTGHTAPAYCWSPSPGEQVDGRKTNSFTPSLVLRGSGWFYLPLMPWGGHTLTNLVIRRRRETCGTEPDPMCSLVLPEQAQPSSVEPSHCPCYAGGSQTFARSKARVHTHALPLVWFILRLVQTGILTWSN